MTDISSLYARCIASGFDHDGALQFVEAAFENELQAAIAALRAGLAEEQKDLVTESH